MLDFGIALDLPDAVDQSLRERDRFVGTAGYMAPEQVAEHVPTLASDWYSVGVLLYEALVGRLPFEGTLVDVMQAKTKMDPVPPSGRVAGVPPDLDELCCGLLDRDPTRRPTGTQIAHRLSGTMRAVRRSAPPATPLPLDREASLVGRAAQGLALREAFDADASRSPRHRPRERVRRDGKVVDRARVPRRPGRAGRGRRPSRSRLRARVGPLQGR